MSFKELRLANPSDTDLFYQQLKNIKRRHAHTNLLVGGFKQYAQLELLGESQINEWLDRFFALRVSTNMLISHYLEIAGGQTSIREHLDADGCNAYQSSINPQ